MLHGTFGPMTVWDQMFAYLAGKGYRVLRFDFFGRGQSACPRLQYKADVFVSQTEELINRLQINNKLVVVGHSLGCIVGGEFAARNPMAIKAMVLVSPSGFPLKSRWIGRLIKSPCVGWFYMMMFGRAFLEKRIRRYYKKSLGLLEINNILDCQEDFKGFKRAYRSTLRYSPTTKYLQGYARLEKLKLPKLLVWGRGDRVTPFRKSVLALKVMPTVKLFPVDDAGHVPQVEQANAVNDILNPFLMSLQMP